jgi:hypothetical protein
MDPSSKDIVRVHMVALGILLLFSTLSSVGKVLLDGSGGPIIRLVSSNSARYVDAVLANIHSKGQSKNLRMFYKPTRK